MQQPYADDEIAERKTRKPNKKKIPKAQDE